MSHWDFRRDRHMWNLGGAKTRHLMFRIPLLNCSTWHMHGTFKRENVATALRWSQLAHKGQNKTRKHMRRHSRKKPMINGLKWNNALVQKHVLTYFKYIFQQIPAQGCFNVPMLEATSISGHQILWPRAKPVWIVWIAMVAPMCRWFNMLYRFYPLNMRLSIATLNNVMVYYIYICVSKYIYIQN